MTFIDPEKEGGPTVVDREPSAAHIAGIAALAEVQLAAMGAALTVYVDQVPADDDPGGGPEFPYVVFWSQPGTPLAEAERLRGWGGEITTTTQATVVGLSQLDVLGGVDRVVAALHRRKPVLTGRVPGDITADGLPGRPVVDPVPTPKGRPVFTAPLFFTLHSSPSNS